MTSQNIYPNGQGNLSLSSCLNAHKPPKTFSRNRKAQPMTSYSKAMVKNCIFYLEQRFTRHKLAFATYTLPDLCDEHLELLNQNWNELIRQFIQKLKRELEKHIDCDEALIVYVNEIQEKRSEREKKIYPHLHVVFQSRKKNYSTDFFIEKKRNTELWQEALSNILGVNIAAPYAAEIKTIEKSAEAYMAKYMSKGSQTMSNFTVVELDKLPKCNWWGATLKLRKWVKDNIRVFTDESKLWLMKNYRKFIGGRKEQKKDSPFVYLFLFEIEELQPSGEITKKPISISFKIKQNRMNFFQYKDFSQIDVFENLLSVG